MMEVSLADVVDAIQVLVSPLSSGDCQNYDAASLDQLFAVNIRKLQDVVRRSPKLAVCTDRVTFDVEEISAYDVRWHFVMCNIQLLQLLCKTLSEITERCSALPGHTAGINPETHSPPVSSDMLSLTQRKAVSSALQFVSGLGVCPLLMTGVGIPLRRRSELACRLVTEDMVSGLSDCDKYHRLTVCIDVLLDCFEQPTLASIILSAHLCDLLASLMQVCYAPTWKTCTAEFQETRSCRCSPRIYVDELTKLKNKLPSSVLVRELLVLQSGCPPSPNMKVPSRPPVWLRKLCQSCLQQIITKPNGVLNVLVNIVQGDDTSVADCRKCEAAARIIVDCCQSKSAYEHHFHVLAPQVELALNLMN